MKRIVVGVLFLILYTICMSLLTVLLGLKCDFKAIITIGAISYIVVLFALLYMRRGNVK